VIENSRSRCASSGLPSELTNSPKGINPAAAAPAASSTSGSIITNGPSLVTIALVSVDPCFSKGLFQKILKYNLNI
jgi:hypothetical protein